MLLQFVYASGLSVTNEGAGVLLNAVGDQPAKVLWVPDDGQELTLVNYPDIINPSRLPLRFTIAGDGSRILFSNTLSGKVFTVHWPIDDS